MNKDLYFFQNESGKIKIGYSENVEQRRIGIQNQSGVKIDCINVVVGAAEYERALHEYYSEYRKDGEWFTLPANEVEFVTQLTIEQLQKEITLPESNGYRYEAQKRKKELISVYIPKQLKESILERIKIDSYGSISSVVKKALIEYFKAPHKQKSTHTPGPWHVINESGTELIKISDSDNFDICELFPYIDLYEESEYKANAKLIAAAPEMLEYLFDLFNDKELILSLNDGMKNKLFNIIIKSTTK